MFLKGVVGSLIFGWMVAVSVWMYSSNSEIKALQSEARRSRIIEDVLITVCREMYLDFEERRDLKKRSL